MITTKLIPYNHEEYPLEGFFASLDETKRPLVILCHAWRGRDDFICEKAKSLAALGYAAFALDVYGKGVLGSSKEENAALKKPFVQDRAFLQKRLLEGYRIACAMPNIDKDRIAVVGFGFGGLCSLDLARCGLELRGAVSIYGHFDRPRNCEIQPITTKILVIHGYNDPITTMSELQAFQHELDQAEVDWQLHLFGNAMHAFANPLANDPSLGVLYNREAAEHAWFEVEKFLERCL